MTVYNPYTDIKNYINLPDIQSEVVPKTTVFAVYPDEEIMFDTENIIKHPISISSLTEQPLTQLQRQIISFIASYEYVTSKMIVEGLDMLGIKTDYDHVSKACDRMRKVGLIHASRFVNSDGKPINYIVYSISKLAGECTVHNNGIHVNHVDSYNITTAPYIIKKVLAANQIIFAYLKRGYGGKIISSIEKSKRIACAADNEVNEKSALRPSVTIEFSDKSAIFYEICRTEQFWEPVLKDKLLRYKMLIENWHTNNLNSEYDVPSVVLCCENQLHSAKCNAIADEIGIKVLFTHDLLLFGEQFDMHIYALNSDNIPEYYRLEQDENATIAG